MQVLSNSIEQHINNPCQQHSIFRGVKNAHGQLLAPDTKAYYRAVNMFDAFASVVQMPQCLVQSPAPPQKISSHSKTPSQPFRFLDLPLEIRSMIYGHLVASNQPIQIDCDHANMRQSSESLKVYRGHTDMGWNQCTCHHVDSSIHAGRHKSAFVSYDLQTNKQQSTTEEHVYIEEHLLIQARTRRLKDVRLLRTCRQIYYEACSVLYLRNTFEFLCLAAFATYFGLQAPDHLLIPRSTEPHRLRAIQSMTKIKVRIAGRNQHRSFLSTSRIIRAGLGCLSNITSFELCFTFHNPIETRPDLMMIDDSMFSKPPSLRKLVVSVRELKLWYEEPINEQDQLDIAKELMRRLLKEEDFSDTIELFQPLNNPSASTKSLSRT